MSKTIIGDVCAYIKKPGQEKASYPRIGVAFEDARGRISLKIDTLPIKDWEGWVNIFPRQGNTLPDSPQIKKRLSEVS